MAGLHGPHEVHRVGLVQLQHGDVRLQAPAQVHLPEQGRGDPAHEVGAGAVGEHPQPLGFQQLHGHLGGGGLAVGPGDHDDAVGQPGQLAGDEAGVGLLHEQSGEGGAAAAQAGGGADALPDQAREGSGSQGVRHGDHPTDRGEPLGPGRSTLSPRAGMA
ncbi:Uncharacterised protein [Mycobacteroides abscessus subsp. abscessus]|nr:Uncharacterised protein [Mycobacteroides abscessus subsp. abscessus]